MRRAHLFDCGVVLLVLVERRQLLPLGDGEHRQELGHGHARRIGSEYAIPLPKKLKLRGREPHCDHYGYCRRGDRREWAEVMLPGVCQERHRALKLMLLIA